MFSTKLVVIPFDLKTLSLITPEIFMTAGVAVYSPQIFEPTKSQAFSTKSADNLHLSQPVPVKMHFGAYARTFISIQCYPIRLWQLIVLIYLIIEGIFFGMDWLVYKNSWHIQIWLVFPLFSMRMKSGPQQEMESFGTVHISSNWQWSYQ